MDYRAEACARHYEDQEARAEVLSREVEARLPDEIAAIKNDAEVWVSREVEDPFSDLACIYRFALQHETDPAIIGEQVLIALYDSARQAAARKVPGDRS